jgi:hypothetical protein
MQMDERTDTTFSVCVHLIHFVQRTSNNGKGNEIVYILYHFAAFTRTHDCARHSKVGKERVKSSLLRQH